MPNAFYLKRFLIFGVLFLYLSSTAFAQSNEKYVPDALKPWVKWVLERDETRQCSFQKNSRQCIWPGRISLSLNANGGEFEFATVTEKQSEVVLPGGALTWPDAVRVIGSSGDSAVPVKNVNGVPAVELSSGEFLIKGRFRWKKLPDSLNLPKNTAIVSLNLNGKSISDPKLGINGELWLKSDESAKTTEQDSLSIFVARKLVDGVPFSLNTNLKVRVGGKARDIVLGKIVPDGFLITEVQSPLDYRLDGNQLLTFKGRPGTHNILLYASRATPPVELSPVSNTSEGWPESEIWVWAPDESFRGVELSGALPIDPNRTELSDDWRSHSAYQLSAEEKLTFKELRRGKVDSLPNTVSLKRQLWLDLDGMGFSVLDTFSGMFQQKWRLNLQNTGSLEAVKVDNVAQLITEEAATNLKGVELRNQNLNMQGESRWRGSIFSIPAIGWDTDVERLESWIYLPPGWKLLGVGGGGKTTQSWLDRWTLLDLFVVLLIAVAMTKLISLRAAAVLLIVLVITHGDYGAPYYIWFTLLAALALLKVLPEGAFRKGLTRCYDLLLVFLGIFLVVYFSRELVSAMYPHVGTYAWPVGALRAVVDIVELLASGVGVTLLGVLLVVFYLWQHRGDFSLWKIILGFVGIIIFLSVFSFVMQVFRKPASEQFVNVGRSVGGGDMAEFSGDTLSLQESTIPQAAPSTVPLPRSRESRKNDIRGLTSDSSSYGYPYEEEKFAVLGKRQAELAQVDAKAVVQTGSGLPDWGRNYFYINWDGPVKQSAKLKLYILGTTGNFILTLIKIGLLIFITLVFYHRRSESSGRFAGSPFLTMGLVLAFGLNVQSARAEDFPSDAILKELETKVTATLCTVNCTSVSSMAFSLSGSRLTVNGEVHSKGPGAFAIPGPVDEFAPSSVSIDGKATTAMRREPGNILWLRVPDGVHKFQVSGTLPERNSIALRFETNPGFVEFTSEDWVVEGISDTGSVRQSVQFLRKEPVQVNDALKTEGEREVEAVLTPWILVNRYVGLSTRWIATTTVTRSGNLSRAQIIRIPLLPGEELLTSNMEMENGEVLVSFARGVSTISWESNFKESDRLSFTATAQEGITETWELECSAIWKCEVSGVTATSHVKDGKSKYTWRPFPGESVSVATVKPTGAAGAVVAIESANVFYNLGDEQQNGTLSLKVKASTGERLRVKLSETSQLESLAINGVRRDEASMEKGVIDVPIEPGSSNYEIRFREDRGIAWYYRAPKIDLNRVARNVRVNINIPSERWTLFLGGPSWGPSVLFWPQLIIILIIAVVLGRSGKTPLSVKEWVLLSLGLSSLTISAFLVPVVWFVALEFRKRSTFQSYPAKFNAFQLVLVFLTVATVLVLFDAVRQGLILHPNMHVAGNNSSNSNFHWYVDIISGVIPSPWVFSTPKWVWRVVMLLWSLWLAFAFFRWLIWAWKCFSADGFWKKKAQAVVA